MELPTLDLKDRELQIGDLVILVDDEGIINDDIIHTKGDILQFIGTNADHYAIGCFIHCKSKKRTDIFADRTLKIIKQLN